LKESELYCRFHLDQELKENQVKYEMVFCPFEPKNAVLKDKLEEHLKTCPKKKELDDIASKPWYYKGINFMNPDLPSCFDKE